MTNSRDQNKHDDAPVLIKETDVYDNHTNIEMHESPHANTNLCATRSKIKTSEGGA